MVEKEEEEKIPKSGFPDGDPRSATSFFKALAHPRRRAVILLLAIKPDSTMTIDELATHIAMLECSPKVPRRQITNVRTSLKRSHRDPLEDASIISTDKETVAQGEGYAQALLVVANGNSINDDKL